MIGLDVPIFRIVEGRRLRFPRHSSLSQVLRRAARSFGTSQCYVVTSPYGVLLFDILQIRPMLLVRVRTRCSALWLLRSDRNYTPEFAARVEDTGLIRWLSGLSAYGGIETQGLCFVHRSGAILQYVSPGNTILRDIRPWAGSRPDTVILRRIFPSVFAGAGWRTKWTNSACLQEFRYENIDLLVYVPGSAFTLPSPPAGFPVPRTIQFPVGNPFSELLSEYGGQVRLGLVRYSVSEHGYPRELSDPRIGHGVIFEHLDGGAGDVIQRDYPVQSDELSYLLRHWRVRTVDLSGVFQQVSPEYRQRIREIYYCIGGDPPVGGVYASMPKGGRTIYMGYMPPILELYPLFLRLDDDAVLLPYDAGIGFWSLIETNTK